MEIILAIMQTHFSQVLSYFKHLKIQPCTCKKTSAVIINCARNHLSDRTLQTECFIVDLPLLGNPDKPAQFECWSPTCAELGSSNRTCWSPVGPASPAPTPAMSAACQPKNSAWLPVNLEPQRGKTHYFCRPSNSLSLPLSLPWLPMLSDWP